MFKPIKHRKISEEIVEQIKNHISHGQLKPGDRVPSERDLATMLGVSRPSVREAIMVLEAMGLVESKQGGGTFVRSLTETSLADPLTNMVEQSPRLMHALVEVRMGLESWSSYLAAKRATDQEIEELWSLYREMEAQSVNGGWDAEIDARFHYAITAATHNTIQVHVLNTIHTLFHATIMTALSEFYTREGYIEKLLVQHRAIVEAIARRDPEGARQAMADHLVMVEKKMAQFMDQNEL